ncbi:MAG: galactose-1-phosphate uridylyltransferase [Bdellovibrionota bacterium]
MYRKDLVKPDGRHLLLYSQKPISEGIVPTNPPHEPITGRSHLRWHPLRGEWVAYASHRQNRTFLPPKEYSPLMVTKTPEFPTELPTGDYQMAVFENLFPSLSMNASETPAPMLTVPTEPAMGVCEVVVFSQDPDTSLANMTLDEVTLVLEVIADRTKEIGARPEIKYVLPFENRGVEVGVTLHHPHGQIYAYPFVPSQPAKMVENQAAYFVKNGRGLLQDMLANEEKDSRRMIASGEHTAAFVPVCARYPYETWVMPRRPVRYLYELKKEELRDLAITLKTLLMKQDALWSKPFPYLLALFQAPTDGGKHEGVHAHFQTFPPLRTSDKLKFLAGTELAAGMFVNDSQPEEKAAELRAVKIDEGWKS